MLSIYNYHDTPSKLSGFDRRSDILPYIINQSKSQLTLLRSGRQQVNYDLLTNTARILFKLIDNRFQYVDTANDAVLVAQQIKEVRDRLQKATVDYLHNFSTSNDQQIELNIILAKIVEFSPSFNYAKDDKNLIWPKNSREFKLIAKDPEAASRFARRAVHYHIPEFEPALLKLPPTSAVDYIEDYSDDGRAHRRVIPHAFIEKMENLIATDVLASLIYVQIADVRTPFLKAEPTIYFNTNKNWRGPTGFPSDETAWDVYLGMLPPREAAAAQQRATRFKK